MNFKFRPSMGNPPNPNPPYFPPPQNPNFSYFTQQAIRVGLRSGGDPRAREFGYGPSPLDMRDSLERELEKERIRAEIIAEEIMRRRVLEQEVRREMMMEREFAFRRAGFAGGSLGPMRGAPSLLTDFEHPKRVWEGVPSSLREVGFRGGCDTLPFQRDPVVAGSGSGGVRLQEIKEVKGVMAPTTETSQDNNKVIILAKPTNLADIKRKAMSPTGSGAIDVMKKQKTKEDWSCALCRVTATSERGLNEHLQGKKHKACEKAMVTQRIGFGTAPLPKTSKTNTGKPGKVPSVTSSPSLGKNGEAECESSFVLAKKTLGVEEKRASFSLNDSSVDKKQNKVAKAPDNSKQKKKFRHYCATCDVGAFSVTVFNAHMEGKRHLANLSQAKKSDEALVGEASTQEGMVVDSKAPTAAKETKEATEAEQVDASKTSVSDVDRVEDPDKVSETVVGESIAPKSTLQVPEAAE